MTMYVTSKTQELNVGEMMSALNKVALPKLRDLKNMEAIKGHRGKTTAGLETAQSHREKGRTWISDIEHHLFYERERDADGDESRWNGGVSGGE